MNSSNLPMIGNYLLGNIIGEGEYFTVRLGKNQLTNQLCAVKYIHNKYRNQLASCINNLNSLCVKQFHNEVKLLSDFRHQNIIKLIDHYEFIQFPNLDNPHSINKYFPTTLAILELACNFDLCEILLNTGYLNELCSRILLKQLIEAVKCLHSNNIVHGDIKPEQVLLNSDFQLKLCDFGYAKNLLKREEWLSSQPGTPKYQPPEVLSAKRNSLSAVKSDITISKPTFSPQKPSTANSHKLPLMARIRNKFSSKPAPVKPSLNTTFPSSSSSSNIGEFVRPAPRTPSYLHIQTKDLHAKSPHSPIISHHTEKSIDCWSCGILLYSMTTGFPPFHMANSSDKHFQLLQAQQYDKFWDETQNFVRQRNQPALSKELIELLSNLLQIDPMKRWTADQVLQCSWLDLSNSSESIREDNPQYRSEMAARVQTVKLCKASKQREEELHESESIKKLELNAKRMAGLSLSHSRGQSRITYDLDAIAADPSITGLDDDVEDEGEKGLIQTVSSTIIESKSLLDDASSLTLHNKSSYSALNQNLKLLNEPADMGNQSESSSPLRSPAIDAFTQQISPIQPFNLVNAGISLSESAQGSEGIRDEKEALPAASSAKIVPSLSTESELSSSSSVPIAPLSIPTPLKAVDLNRMTSSLHPLPPNILKISRGTHRKQKRNKHLIPDKPPALNNTTSIDNRDDSFSMQSISRSLSSIHYSISASTATEASLSSGNRRKNTIARKLAQRLLPNSNRIAKISNNNSADANSNFHLPAIVAKQSSKLEKDSPLTSPNNINNNNNAAIVALSGTGSSLIARLNFLRTANSKLSNSIKANNNANESKNNFSDNSNNKCQFAQPSSNNSQSNSSAHQLKIPSSSAEAAMEESISKSLSNLSMSDSLPSAATLPLSPDNNINHTKTLKATQRSSRAASSLERDASVELELEKQKLLALAWKRAEREMQIAAEEAKQKEEASERVFKAGKSMGFW
jgi:serine/threonine protein kinase